MDFSKGFLQTRRPSDGGFSFRNSIKPMRRNLAAYGRDGPVCVLKSRGENERLLARLAAVH